MKSEIIKLMTQYNDLFYTGEISNQELELSNKRFLDLSTQKTSGIKKLIQISNED
jgi:hypothetical protein